MRLIDADELIESMGVSDAVKWGNKIRRSNSKNNRMPPETAEEKLVVMTPTMAATTAARMPRMLMNGRNSGRHFDHFP